MKIVPSLHLLQTAPTGKNQPQTNLALAKTDSDSLEGRQLPQQHRSNPCSTKRPRRRPFKKILIDLIQAVRMYQQQMKHSYKHQDWCKRQHTPRQRLRQRQLCRLLSQKQTKSPDVGFSCCFG